MREGGKGRDEEGRWEIGMVKWGEGGRRVVLSHSFMIPMVYRDGDIDGSWGVS